MRILNTYYSFDFLIQIMIIFCFELEAVQFHCCCLKVPGIVFHSFAQLLSLLPKSQKGGRLPALQPVQKKTTEWRLIFFQCDFLSFQTLENVEVINADLTNDIFDISGWFLFGRSKILCKAVVVTGHWAVDLCCFTNQNSCGWKEGCSIRFSSSGE